MHKSKINEKNTQKKGKEKKRREEEGNLREKRKYRKRERKATFKKIIIDNLYRFLLIIARVRRARFSNFKSFMFHSLPYLLINCV